uniref:Uncharacterized protein n=1 Tax=Anopheles melas TaxID=34690 RepID=A0A182UG71_9DIPT
MLLTVSELVTCCSSDTTDDGCVLPFVLSSEPTPGTDAEGLVPVPSPATPFGTTWAALTTPFSPVPLLSGPPFVGMVPFVVLPVLPVLQLLPLLLMLMPLAVSPLPPFMHYPIFQQDE